MFSGWNTFEIPQVISYSSAYQVRPDHLGLACISCLSHLPLMLHRVQSASERNRRAGAWPWPGVCDCGPLCGEELMRPNGSGNRIWACTLRVGFALQLESSVRAPLVRWDWMRFYSWCLNNLDPNVTGAARRAVAWISRTQVVLGKRDVVDITSGFYK